MRTFWKVFAALVLVLPLGAFVAGNLVASAADDPAPRQTIQVSEPSATPSPASSGTPTPAPSSTPASSTPASSTPASAPTSDDSTDAIPQATQRATPWDDHGGDDHSGRGRGGDDSGDDSGDDDSSGHGSGHGGDD